MCLQTEASIQRGEDLALQYLDALYSYAFGLTRNRTDAEDLVQETYLRSMTAANRLRAESNVKSWLFTVLRNTWFNQLRKRRTAHEVDGVDIDQFRADSHGFDNPEAALEGKVDREQVREAIRRLPLEFREVVLLREYGDLSYQEMAGVLNCPIGTVMSRLGRARSKLREFLSAANSPVLRKAGI